MHLAAVNQEFHNIKQIQNQTQYLFQEVTMIDFLFLTLPNDLAYNDLKKDISFPEHLQPYSHWAFKFPLTIYSEDIKTKHVFHRDQVQVQDTNAVLLQQKWKYFILTQGDNRKIYCTSYVFYEKQALQITQSSFFQIQGPYISYSQFYLPKCLILRSQKPFFKLQTNLIKIHRQLRKNNYWIFQHIVKESLSVYQNLPEEEPRNYKIKLRSSLISSTKQFKKQRQETLNRPQTSIEDLFKYYVWAANQTVTFEKIYICSQNKLQILHLYPLTDSLYRLNYFFHIPISLDNLACVFAAIFQERQIIFTSSNQNSNLMLIETLLEMIRPFVWQFMYAPNLPEDMLDAAEHSFMPYIVGIHRKYLDRISKRGRVIVYVDTDCIEADQQIMELPKQIKRLIENKSSANSLPYLEWEIEMRVKSILMVTLIIEESKKISKNPRERFYKNFFENSAMFNSYQDNQYKRNKSEISELFGLTFQAKVKKINHVYKILYSQASFPSFCQNQIGWKNYCNLKIGQQKAKRMKKRTISNRDQQNWSVQSSTNLNQIKRSTMGNRQQAGKRLMQKKSNDIGIKTSVIFSDCKIDFQHRVHQQPKKEFAFFSNSFKC